MGDVETFSVERNERLRRFHKLIHEIEHPLFHLGRIGEELLHLETALVKKTETDEERDCPSSTGETRRLRIHKKGPLQIKLFHLGNTAPPVQQIAFYSLK